MEEKPKRERNSGVNYRNCLFPCVNLLSKDLAESFTRACLLDDVMIR